jgi:amidase
VGTETDGSIICPSSANGLVGLKPTVGLVSRSWIIPISVSQDTAGPMGRSVRDVAILLSALAGSDPADAATAAAGKHTRQDYTRFLDPAGLKGARIGVARELCGFHEEVDAIFERAVATMGRLGAEIIDPAPELDAKRLGKPEMELLLYEFKTGLNAYLKSLGDRAPVRSLAEVIRFNLEHRGQELRYFGQELLVKAQRKGPLTERAYLEAVATTRRLARDQGIDAALAARRLDAIVAPSGGPAWKIDLVTGDHFLGGSSSAAAVAGYPNITVPAGQVHGLPVGISFFSGAWREPELLRFAYCYEQATRHRRPPDLRPSLGYG